MANKEEIDFDRIANKVKMTADYTTDSCNLGRRTYRATLCYQVDDVICKEMLAANVAEKISFYRPPYDRARAEYDLVEIVPAVTRWFSSSGRDTITLCAGVKVAVPSNLAVHLLQNGLASAA